MQRGVALGLQTNEIQRRARVQMQLERGIGLISDAVGAEVTLDIGELGALAEQEQRARKDSGRCVRAKHVLDMDRALDARSLGGLDQDAIGEKCGIQGKRRVILLLLLGRGRARPGGVRRGCRGRRSRGRRRGIALAVAQALVEIVVQRALPVLELGQLVSLHLDGVAQLAHLRLQGLELLHQIHQTLAQRRITGRYRRRTARGTPVRRLVFGQHRPARQQHREQAGDQRPAEGPPHVGTDRYQ
jgi:hypothetical protein